MKKKLQLLSFLACILMFTSLSYAYTVSYEPGITQVTKGFSGYSTYGSTMDGMTITAMFADQSSESLIWDGTSSYGGGVSGNGWSLSESGDTSNGQWGLSLISDISITQLLIDAGTGDAVFDTILYPYYTGGSGLGREFYVQSASDYLDIAATYYNQVALIGTEPLGDVYRNLSIEFLNDEGFKAGSGLNFVADTDSLLFPGDINPVPEPATILLLGSGLLGLGVCGRKKFKK